MTHPDIVYSVSKLRREEIAREAEESRLARARLADGLAFRSAARPSRRHRLAWVFWPFDRQSPLAVEGDRTGASLTARGNRRELA